MKLPLGECVDCIGCSKKAVLYHQKNSFPRRYDIIKIFNFSLHPYYTNPQNTPLFLKKRWGAGGQNFLFCREDVKM